MKIKDKIKELEELIEFRDTDETWLNANRESRDTNEYFWRRTGERSFYVGKLAALRELLK